VPGELVSIIGPNGAGKTTLFNLLTGQLAPTSGRVLLEGRDVNALPPHRRARLGLGRTFQISQTLTTLTVLENAMVGSFLKHPRLTDAARHAQEVLDRVGLGARAGIKAGSLTLSERRRLEVARALALEPRMILLDEVMAGLNQTRSRRSSGWCRA
jgi:branched-chain amino acid transport system ATP-binding protein